MKYLAIIFTFMPPYVGPMEQALPMKTLDKCESFISRTREVYEKADDSFRWQLECKKKEKA